MSPPYRPQFALREASTNHPRGRMTSAGDGETHLRCGYLTTSLRWQPGDSAPHGRAVGEYLSPLCSVLGARWTTNKGSLNRMAHASLAQSSQYGSRFCGKAPRQALLRLTSPEKVPPMYCEYVRRNDARRDVAMSPCSGIVLVLKASCRAASARCGPSGRRHWQWKADEVPRRPSARGPTNHRRGRDITCRAT
ncbi:hypothetical protein L226DRAFT_122049 [Lentinus tigrinus ALCF2SS1-7]|uniref:Uncharacterized protein n=1 Tax=Lentinus tigrinus ALCF2SS1-6 TaxID=1328759 RepID=A0A5C2STB8_9APHY|nr:hypothetical protein L227DRAFT_7722 [Lentinus tigrinus ALCF2SS1-6]RPD80835.1 hypothetical protein L226DRAFT_122049 [Lentinus tigrinus ALCF2SS1-7]